MDSGLTANPMNACIGKRVAQSTLVHTAWFDSRLGLTRVASCKRPPPRLSFRLKPTYSLARSRDTDWSTLCFRIQLGARERARRTKPRMTAPHMGFRKDPHAPALLEQCRCVSGAWLTLLYASECPLVLVRCVSDVLLRLALRLAAPFSQTPQPQTSPLTRNRATDVSEIVTTTAQCLACSEHL